jgi:uncharacterized protein YyaL (SSP411 family)
MEMKKTAFMIFAVCVISVPLFANHLSGETSPYLKEHASQPVDWYPWGKEAFDKAKKEHKPIFLSLGYRTCHWCHVMARESFENREIASMLNRWFVAIKIDREEMPHLDAHFRRIYRRLRNRRAGWPLTILLTEDLMPFFAGTHIPPTDAYGVMGMKTLLPYFGRLYPDPGARKKLIAEAEKIMTGSDHTAESASLQIDPDSVSKHTVEALWKIFDHEYGGFGKSPKYPQSSTIRLLMELAETTGDRHADTMALQTLEAMRRGGIYDQIDGAFFRYCTDRKWHMPHFEKMLYTNAELIPLYLRAWNRTGKQHFKKVAFETVREIRRRFETPEGLYYAASDSDSDGEEGAYFLHMRSVSLKTLTENGFSLMEAEKILDFLDIRQDGNFDSELAQPRLDSAFLPKGFEHARSLLGEERAKRHSYPFIDTKIITSWNAMMLRALFVFSRAYPEEVEKTEHSYNELKRLMEKKDGSLFHQTLYGRAPTQEGLLEDYAFMTAAALEGYQRTLRQSYMDDAVRWSTCAIKRFYAGNGRWLAGRDRIESYADLDDSYYTSALSTMLGSLLELASLTDNLHTESIVRLTLERHGSELDRHPENFPEAVRVYLRMRRGIITLKAKRKILRRFYGRIGNIRYPYLLLHAEEDLEAFLACKLRGCIGYSKDFGTIKRIIEKRYGKIKKKKAFSTPGHKAGWRSNI